MNGDVFMNYAKEHIEIKYLKSIIDNEMRVLSTLETSK